MSVFYGELRVFTFVSLNPDDKAKRKRVSLGTIYCEFEQSKSKLEEFRRANLDVCNPKEVFAEFIYRELFD